MVVEVKVRGVPELQALLKSIPDKLRRRALRNALAAGARVVRDEARQRAPVLVNAMKAPFRTPGTVKRAITVRTSKVARRSGDVGVFVNVRPLKSGVTKAFKQATGRRGSQNPKDPFYWRWLEFGTAKMAARPFLTPAAKRLSDALQVFIRTIGPQIQKLDTNKDAL
jgi:HK97 gp10 family phage protein